MERLQMPQLPASRGKAKGDGSSSRFKTPAKCPRIVNHIPAEHVGIYRENTKHGELVGAKASLPQAAEKPATIHVQ